MKLLIRNKKTRYVLGEKKWELEQSLENHLTEKYSEYSFSLYSDRVKCKTNFPISKKTLGLDEIANYFLDFYFEDKQIDLEIDGKQHEYEDRKTSDIQRDKLLINFGIKVYRIKWKNINNEKGKNYIKEEINKFLEFYNGI